MHSCPKKTDSIVLLFLGHCGFQKYITFASNKKFSRLFLNIKHPTKVLDADPKVIQQINFTGHLERDDCAIMFFIIEKAKETVLDFSQGTLKVL